MLPPHIIILHSIHHTSTWHWHDVVTYSYLTTSSPPINVKWHRGHTICSIFFNIPFYWNIFRFSCHHDTRNRIGSKLEKIKKSPFKGFFQKMGNKLSCSCGPLKIKGYRFDDPWAANTRTRRNGHLLRWDLSGHAIIVLFFRRYKIFLLMKCYWNFKSWFMKLK